MAASLRGARSRPARSGGPGRCAPQAVGAGEFGYRSGSGRSGGLDGGAQRQAAWSLGDLSAAATAEVPGRGARGVGGGSVTAVASSAPRTTHCQWSPGGWRTARHTFHAVTLTGSDTRAFAPFLRRTNLQRAASSLTPADRTSRLAGGSERAKRRTLGADLARRDVSVVYFYEPSRRRRSSPV